MITRKDNLMHIAGILILALALLVSAIPAASVLSADSMPVGNHEMHVANDLEMSGHCDTSVVPSEDENCCDSEPCDGVCLNAASSFITGRNIEILSTDGLKIEGPDPTRLTDQFCALLLPPPIINS